MKTRRSINWRWRLFSRPSFDLFHSITSVEFSLAFSCPWCKTDFTHISNCQEVKVVMTASQVACFAPVSALKKMNIILQILMKGSGHQVKDLCFRYRPFPLPFCAIRFHQWHQKPVDISHRSQWGSLWINAHKHGHFFFASVFNNSCKFRSLTDWHQESCGKKDMWKRGVWGFFLGHTLHLRNCGKAKKFNPIKSRTAQNYVCLLARLLIFDISFFL